MINKRSSQLFVEAKKLIPGGVNSPVRAFKSVGGTPIFIKKAKGAYLIDEDDNKYIDYISSWGPMILGHAKNEIIEKIVSQAEKGTSYGIPTELESELASLIVSNIKNIDKIRFVNSGTEACMSAPVVPDECVNTLSVADVSKTFIQVNIHKAAGPNGLQGHALRACTNQLACVFTDIF